MDMDATDGQRTGGGAFRNEKWSQEKELERGLQGSGYLMSGGEGSSQAQSSATVTQSLARGKSVNKFLAKNQTGPAVVVVGQIKTTSRLRRRRRSIHK